MNSQGIKCSLIPDCEEPCRIVEEEVTVDKVKVEGSVQTNEHEMVSKVVRSANTSARRDTRPFPDMSRESISIDQLEQQFGLFEWAKWRRDEAKINKMVSWIVATPNWQQNSTLSYWYEVCHKDLEKLRLRKEYQVENASKEGMSRNSECPPATGSIDNSTVQKETGLYFSMLKVWKSTLGRMFEENKRASKTD